MDYHIAKGVFDILPQDPEQKELWKESFRWQQVEQMAREIAGQYCFSEIRTPLFENTALFNRSIGENTDIVAKEMYTFLDRAGRSLTLRPEGTAPVMRAFIENRLDQKCAISKFFYINSMFRYERQQAGRYRQHHQFGVEAIGSKSALQDAEIIDLLFSFLKRLGIKNLNLQINSIGNAETRNHYKNALKNYLHPYLPQLSEDSQKRFETNPLRILDSKNQTDKKILKEAPSILDFLDSESKEHFESLCESLDLLSIPYLITPTLVRGLDYYTKTVFEISAPIEHAQNALGGGGRYDGLMQSLNGPDLPASGFGAGIERIIQTMIAQNCPFHNKDYPLLYIIGLDSDSQKIALQLLSTCRAAGIAAEMDFSQKKLKAMMHLADSRQARFVALIGQEEIEANCIALRNMKSGEVVRIERAQFMVQFEKRVKDEIL